MFEGLETESLEKFAADKMEYAFIKPNAYNSRPLEQVKKIAVTTFALSGITYFYDIKDNKFLDQTREREVAFP